MNDFVVGIPSYKRPLEQGSLEYLKSMGFPKEDIYIFVQTEQDEKAYKQAHGEFANIIFRPANGVAKARNNILDFFDGKQNILMLDDDIKHIGRLRNELEPITSLKEFGETINKCFKTAADIKALMFGVYAVYNSFYMSQSITIKTTVNTLLGFPKGFSLRFDESYTAKEDIELCGRILNAGGKIIRYDFLAVEAKHRTNDGGCKEIWASGKHEETVKRLCMKYPNVFAPKKNNPKEVRLKNISKKIQL